MRYPLQRCLRPAAALSMLTFAAWAFAQMHRVEKPEAVVRAVGVYEWTGELAKPAASRLIPVTVFINGELEDGAIYQPRPIPFALTPGNVYELQQAGLPRSLLELHSASKQPDADTGNVDGWWGYGSVQQEPKPKTTRAKNENRPILPDKTNDDSKASHADADRPTLRRRSTTGASKAPATPSPTTDPTSTPAEDPDRPTLKRHAPETAPGKQDAGDVSAEREIQTDSLNNDPNRPVLHRGKPVAGADAADPSNPKLLASLAGMPEDLHQIVAVSDPAYRPEHDFARPWADDAEHKAIQASLEVIARSRLAAYNTVPSPGSPQSGALVGAKDAEGKPTGPTGGPAFTPSGGATAARSASTSKQPDHRATVAAHPATQAARRRAAAAAAAARKAAATAAPALLGEDIRGFLLSYGGAPTYVLTAHTAAADGTFRYVTVVAQQDAFGALQTALASVTDSSHLDRTPWMRLVGVVDVEASNRASLLFELREGNARQFALYRVLSGRSEPLFTTGLTQ